MSAGTILLVIGVLMLVCDAPRGPNGETWSIWPRGGLGLLVIVVVELVLIGRL